MEEWNSSVDLPWIRGTSGRFLVLVGQNPIISEVHVKIPQSHSFKALKTQVLKFLNLKESVLKTHCWVPQYRDSIIYG